MNVKTAQYENKYGRWRLPTAWLALVVFDATLIAIVCAQEGAPREQLGDTAPAEIIRIEGPENSPPDEIHFEALDVYIDTGDRALAAWQFELQSRTPGVEIVGIEGGEHAAFREPPYYDSRAMMSNRVIIGAFNTGNNLPRGRSRVARIHVQIQGGGMRTYKTRLSVSATTGGKRIPAKATINRTKA